MIPKSKEIMRDSAPLVLAPAVTTAGVDLLSTSALMAAVTIGVAIVTGVLTELSTGSVLPVSLFVLPVSLLVSTVSLSLVFAALLSSMGPAGTGATLGVAFAGSSVTTLTVTSFGVFTEFPLFTTLDGVFVSVLDIGAAVTGARVGC